MTDQPTPRTEAGRDTANVWPHATEGIIRAEQQAALAALREMEGGWLVGHDAALLAQARTEALDLTIGPIEHSNSMCQKTGCECWCQACERHNWRHARTEALDVDALTLAGQATRLFWTEEAARELLREYAAILAAKADR